MSDVPTLLGLLHRDGDGIIVNGSRGKKQAWTVRHFTEVAKAARLCKYLADQGQNVYVKHGVHDGQTKISRKTGKIIPNCAEDHFLGSRSFFVDVDVGPDKFYVTKQDATFALRHATVELHKLGIPYPNMLLWTGGGYHIAWIVDDLIQPAEWKRLTGILYALLRNNKLGLDSAVEPIDRGVRMCGPNYYNINHGQPVGTQIISARPPYDTNSFKATLQQHSLRPVTDDGAVPKQAAALDNKEFKTPGGSFELNLDLILDDCIVLNQAVATGGAGDDRAQWLDLMGLVAKAGDEEDGWLYAKMISQDHPDYDEEETRNLFDDLRSRNKGYTHCATLQNRMNSRTGVDKTSLCTTCKWYKKFTSPAGIQGVLQRSGEAKREKPVFVKEDERILEGPYYNTEQGIYRSGKEDAFIWADTRITELQLKKLDTDDEHDFLVFVKSNPKGGSTKQVHLDTMGLSDERVLVKRMSQEGILVQTHQAKPVYNMMVSWLENLRALRQHTVKYTRLGWTHGKTSFVLGTSVYHANGDIEQLPRDPMLNQFDPHGSRQEYDRIAQAILGNEQRPEAHAFVAASFGSALLDLCSLTGISLNFYSARSGYGKTTISKLAASVWGDAKPMTFTLDDTQNAMHHKSGILNNLPTMFDELRAGGDAAKAVGAIAFRVASGQEKSRMTKDAKLQEARSWRSFTIFSTNYSFADLAQTQAIGGDAALARVMDFVVSPLPAQSTVNAGLIALETGRLEHVNGHIGHVFIADVVRHRELYTTAINTVFSGLMQRAHKSNADVSGRNHAAAGAVMIVAAKIVERLGLMPLNPALVRDAVLTAIAGMGQRKKGAQIAMAPMAVVGEFLKATEANRLMVRAQGKVKLITNTNFRKPISYVLDLNSHNIVVDVSEFTKWMHTMGYIAASILGPLQKHRDMQYLAHGTVEVSATKRHVLAIPMSKEFKEALK